MFTDAVFVDDIALLANSPAQAESLLHSLQQAAGGIALQVNADKAEYTCFNQRSHISTLKWGLLKLMEKFTYIGNCISSNDNDINKRLAKAWIAIDRLRQTKHAGHCWRSKDKFISDEPLHMDKRRQNDQLESIYINSGATMDVAWKISREQWMIETSGERESQDIRVGRTTWWWWWWW